MTAPNPFATAPAQAPATIPDSAAQQLGAPPAQQPSAFTQAAAPELAQMQNPVQQAFEQQHAQQMAGHFHQVAPNSSHAQHAANIAQQMQQPQGMPGQPWNPAQHQQHGQQFAPQASAPAIPQQQAPAQGLQFGAPAFAAPAQHQQAGPAFPAAAQPQGQAYDPSLFGQPSAGGGGTYPKVRDIEGRLVLIRVKNRNSVGTDYNDKTKSTINYIANVAILDGGPVYASPNAENPMAQPELVSETVPYVISDMIISQVGLQNRLKNDFVRGRMMRHPKGELEKQLLERFPGMAAPQALFSALQQGLLTNAHLVSGTFFWTIVEDSSPEADQLVGAFAGHPSARDLMS